MYSCAVVKRGRPRLSTSKSITTRTTAAPALSVVTSVRTPPPPLQPLLPPLAAAVGADEVSAGLPEADGAPPVSSVADPSKAAARSPPPPPPLPPLLTATAAAAAAAAFGWPSPTSLGGGAKLSPLR